MKRCATQAGVDSVNESTSRGLPPIRRSNYRHDLDRKDLECTFVDDDEAARYTIGWICPTSPEYVAALAAMPKNAQVFVRDQTGWPRYLGGQIGFQWVVVAEQHEMGQRGADELYRKMSKHFPSITDYLVVGMAGGLPQYAVGHHNQPIVLGDVVISAPKARYAAIAGLCVGADTASGFVPMHHNSILPTPRLAAAIASFKENAACNNLANPPVKLSPNHVRDMIDCARDRKAVPTNEDIFVDPEEPDSIRDLLFPSGLEHYPETSSTGQRQQRQDFSSCLPCDPYCIARVRQSGAILKSRGTRGPRAVRERYSPLVHWGPVASFDSMRLDPKKRDELEGSYLCVEMEAAAFATQVLTVTIRGIMDYADSHRAHGDLWRDYACITAAATARCIISHMATYEPPPHFRPAPALAVRDPHAVRNLQIREDEKEACLRSLAFDVIEARLNDIQPALANTCDWLFQAPEFRQWRDPEHLPEHKGVLWIKGKPGAGKSTLMKHAYRQFQSRFFRDHLIVAYFFNARGETLEKTPLGLLRSMVYQLVKGSDEIYEQFSMRFREKQRVSRGTDLQWRLSELQEFVRSVISQPLRRPLLFLVDALDECDTSDVRNMVRFLETLSTNAIPYDNIPDDVPLQICLSSRHYPNIGIRKVVELVVDGNLGHQADIAEYVGEHLIIHDDTLEAEVVQRANSVFLWVVIVISLLNQAYDEGRMEAMQKTLEEIPSDLESVFSRILDQGNASPTETLSMLQWVLLSSRPLTPSELFAAAVNIPPPSLDVIKRRITASSKGLIEVRKSRGDDSDEDDSVEDDSDGDEAYGTVQFIHQSVSDFLFRQKRLQTLDPTLGPEPIVASHGRLWERCWSSIEAADPTMASEQNLRKLRDKDPLLVYAAENILGHAEKALSRGALRQAGDGRESHIEDHPNSSDTSQQVSFTRWMRNPGHWLQRWKLFRSSAESAKEANGIEMDTGLLYIVSIQGLPKLLNAICMDADFNAQDLNAQGGRYGNALQAASWRGNQDIVRLLIDKGADINAQGGLYGNALQAAASQSRNQEIVRLLIDKGADINAQGGRYGNALQAAVLFSVTQETVRLLIDKDADINAQGGQHGNALQAASWRGNQEIVQLLIDKGADIDAQSGKYGNALQAASFRGNQETVRLLINKGADINAQGGRYGNALRAAQRRGWRSIVQLLRENGAIEYEEGGPWAGNDFLGEVTFWC